MMDDLCFLECKSELGAGKRGASLGIEALKFAFSNRNDELFENLSIEAIPDYNHLLKSPPSDRHAKWIDGVFQVSKNIMDSICQTVKKQKPFILFDGDHSCALGAIAGIKKANPKHKIGVVWIDAHADLHTPFTTPTGNVHGMPLAASLGVDNKEHAINKPHDETLEQWDLLKNIGAINPKIFFEDIVIIGLRSMEEQEKSMIDENNIKYYDMPHIHRAGIDTIIHEVEEGLAHCDSLYLSFDVDSLDPKLSDGTGTPVENGLKYNEAEHLVTQLFLNAKTIGLEITEINPLLDTKNKMGKMIAKVLENIILEYTQS